MTASSPTHPPLSGVIFFGAHPDDETIMAGGLLALLHDRGVPTHVVCATDGRGGEADDVADADTPDKLAEVRIAELRCATGALGATSLSLLGYEDPIMGAGDENGAELFGFKADEAILNAQIASAIQRSNVDIVLTHGSDGEYGHPAHIQLHRAVLRSVQSHKLPVTVYGIAATVPTIEDRLWNTSDPAHIVLDISPWAEAKLAAMACHRTQHALFKRRRKLTHIREALRTTESVHQHYPPLADDAQPNDAFTALLLDAGGWRPE